jgi:hypothetical protein
VKAGKAALKIVEKAENAGSLYVHRPLLNAKRLAAWAEGAGIPNIVPPDQMHVTNVYSRAPVSLAALENSVIVKGDQRSIQPLGDKGAVVLMIQSPELVSRWNEAQRAGASWDHPGGYRPHVTLTYDAGGTDLSEVTPPDFPLEFGPEVHAPLNEDWAEDMGLRKDWQSSIAVSKMDPDQRLVFGWASVSQVGDKVIIDKQGDIIPIAELEKAAYRFVLDSRQQGDMHSEIGVGRVVQSMMFTPEMAGQGHRRQERDGREYLRLARRVLRGFGRAVDRG